MKLSHGIAQSWGLLLGKMVWGRKVASAAVLGLVVFSSLAAYAQPKKDEKPTIPKPEEVTLETKDGLVLRCTWYAGGFVQSPDGRLVTPKDGKKTVPIILLHGWEGQRGDFDGLATLLQRAGHAVIVPDLRGHGGSTRFKYAGAAIDQKKMRAEDFAKMVVFDVEAVKKFLLDRNNAGELNIEQLCVVGTGDMGSVVAMNWAAQDWSWPQLIAFKQGQDVKALVLLSPAQAFKGLTAHKAILHPFIRGQLPVKLSLMIVAGRNDTNSYREARKLHTSFNRYYPDPPREEAIAKQTLFLLLPDTQLQGTQLVDPKLPLDVDRQILQFISMRLVAKENDFQWTLRQNPLRN